MRVCMHGSIKPNNKGLIRVVKNIWIRPGCVERGNEPDIGFAHDPRIISVHAKAKAASSSWCDRDQWWQVYIDMIESSSSSISPFCLLSLPGSFASDCLVSQFCHWFCQWLHLHGSAFCRQLLAGDCVRSICICTHLNQFNIPVSSLHHDDPQGAPLHPLRLQRLHVLWRGGLVALPSARAGRGGPGRLDGWNDLLTLWHHRQVRKVTWQLWGDWRL